MEKRNFRHTKLLVLTSGVFLVMAGVGLLIPISMVQAASSYSLGVFVLITGFLIHSFWKETDRHMKLLELQNFIKNIVIFFEMFYLASNF